MKIKICCIGSLAEAKLAVDAGADVLGLVASMPSGPGVIDESLIQTIAAATPAPTATFLLTSHQRVDAIVAQLRRCGTSAIQLCDLLPAGAHAQLRAALPDVTLVQVIHVGGPGAIDEALQVAPAVDFLLLDSGNQELAVKQLGGTGRTHDWQLSAQICRASPVPVFLAGGLNHANVVAAVEQVRPHGVDLCSSVRSDGHLDAVKLRAFVMALR
jgi:phosphoribosylanthranilate isomerase